MRVLITQNHLFNLSGSEVVTLEMAEYLSSRGDEVVIYTHIYANPIKREFEALANVEVLTDRKEVNTLIKNKGFDLIWIHQQVIPEAIYEINIRESTRIVFHHMSPYHPLEFPISYEIEKSLASLIVFNSDETKESIMATGVLEGFPTERCLVFGNPAPDRFLRERSQSGAKERPEKILVVTNHLAPEVTEALTDLKRRGVIVTILGRGHESNIARVTPELLQRYDVVVTIGKTVQYAICSQMPVYCYDHFGGPGYLNPSNFELAARLNFSGRGFDSKDHLDISTEIIDGYSEAVEAIGNIHQSYAQDFLLSNQIKRIETYLAKDVESLSVMNRQMIERHKKIMELNKMFQNSIYKKDQAIAKQKQVVENIKEVNEQQESELQNMKKSRLWRWGRSVRKTPEKKPDMKAVTVIVPVYGDWESLEENVKALKKYIQPSSGHKVLLVNDCGPEADIIERNILGLIKNNNNFFYHRNEKNLGFVKNCNNAVFALADKTDDILLLNSDAVVTKGFLEHMQEVLYAQSDIGAVCPRSNAATIFSVPMVPKSGKVFTMRESYALYKKILPKLPPYYISPLAHGFCMLIRREVIDQYGLFDEIYGKGYGEENDFCMRIRYEGGWKCAVANTAFVFHYKARSFTPEGRQKLVAINEKILHSRYPEYKKLVKEYVDSINEPRS